MGYPSKRRPDRQAQAVMTRLRCPRLKKGEISPSKAARVPGGVISNKRMGIRPDRGL